MRLIKTIVHWTAHLLGMNLVAPVTFYCDGKYVVYKRCVECGEVQQ